MGWVLPVAPVPVSQHFSSRQVPLEDHVIYSGNLFQYIEENKKWRNRFCMVPHNYGLVLYENKLVRTAPASPPCMGLSPVGDAAHVLLPPPILLGADFPVSTDTP